MKGGNVSLACPNLLAVFDWKEFVPVAGASEFRVLHVVGSNVVFTRVVLGEDESVTHCGSS